MAADDEAHLRLTGDDESLAAALERTDEHIKATERATESLGKAGTKAGEEYKLGMSKAERASKQARNAAGQFAASAHVAGDEAEKAGAKAAVGSTGFDKWGKSASKASKSTGGLKAMIMLIKWGTILTGGQAVVGMLSSLAAGAGMAVGALSPMIGVLGAIGPLMFLAAGAMGFMKISGKDLGALLRPLTNDFMAMRQEITQALVPGVRQFNDEIHDGLIPTLRGGLTGLSGSFGKAMGSFGAMVTRARTVREVGVVFNGLNPIVQLLGTTLGRLFGVFITLTVGALPLANAMGASLDNVSKRLEAWSQRMVDSGKAQAWLMKAWELMKSSGRTLANFLVGIYNLFTLAGQVAREQFGGGLSDASKHFRDWTASAEGSQRILQYFRDSAPALRETLKLLGAIVKGIGGFAADQRVAPLIAQIRTQLLPAIGELANNLTGQNGFGPALITAFSNIAQALSKIPLGGLTALVVALGKLAGAVAWLVDNVPGLGPAIGTFLTLWTVSSASFKVIEKGSKAFGWIKAATSDSKNLSAAQKGLGLVLKGVGPVIDTVGGALKAFGLATWAALGPVGVIILIIGGLVLAFIWAYNKFKWFRDGVWAVIYAVRDAFVWLAKAVAQPFIDLWNIIKSAYNFIAKGWNLIPTIHVPSWVPVIGGSDFGLPKMPLLAQGGVIEYSTAIVGEQGPEALVKDGKLLGMIGTGGPELRTDLPPGGYVVPSLGTLSRTPSMIKMLPSSVADALDTAPGYNALLDQPAALDTAPPLVHVDTGGAEIVEAIHELTDTLERRRPTGDDDKFDKLLSSLARSRRDDKRAAIAKRYQY